MATPLHHSLETLVADLRRFYGDDAAQQALLLACDLADPEPLSEAQFGYTMAFAKRLCQMCYDDRTIGYRHRHLWPREQASGLLAHDPRSPRSALDPFAMVDARRDLQKIPAWLIEKHVQDDFICRHRCDHPMTRWFPAILGGKPTVRCRGCLAEASRQTYHRKKGGAHA